MFQVSSLILLLLSSRFNTRPPMRAEAVPHQRSQIGEIAQTLPQAKEVNTMPATLSMEGRRALIMRLRSPLLRGITL